MKPSYFGLHIYNTKLRLNFSQIKKNRADGTHILVPYNQILSYSHVYVVPDEIEEREDDELNKDEINKKSGKLSETNSALMGKEI